MTRKRSRSVLEPDLRPVRSSKRLHTIPVEEDLKRANARIQELEAQVKELQDYINSSHTATRAPPSIRKQLDNRADAAERLAEQVQDAIERTYGKFACQISNYRRTGVTSDDLSEAMMPYFADIERLRELPGGLNLALDLVLKLGRYSFGDLNSGGCGREDRPSDERADELLVELVKERKRSDPGYDPTSALKELEKTSKYLSAYGIHTYFPRSIDLLTNCPDSSEDE